MIDDMKHTEADIEKDIRAAKAAYAREWRKRNPGKASEYMRRYWMRRVLQEQEKAAGTDDREGS